MDALQLIFFEKIIQTCFVSFRGNEESSSVIEYCMTLMGYNVLYSSFDYVTYVTKFVQARICYQRTFDDNFLLYAVTMVEICVQLCFI